jgi:ABC-type transport system, involved in lipoprotein release, permease component
MKFTSIVAARFLTIKRNNLFFSWIASLSILGVGIGVAVLILVLSVFNGFENELRERYLAANAHILMLIPQRSNSP